MATRNNSISPFSAADQSRITQMIAAWSGYYGRFPRPLKNRMRQPDDSVVVNRVRPIVDKGVSFLFGQDIKFECDAGPEAQAYLDGVWKQNRQASLLQRLALNGGVTGMGVLKIVPQAPYPRLIVVDPSIMAVRHTLGDFEDVTTYTLTYETVDEDGKPAYERELIRRESPLSWSITQQSGKPDEWVTNDTQTWAYPFPPISAAQNLPAPSEYWGLSDIGPDLIQLNTDLNFVLSNINRILKVHASPKVIGAGFTVDQINFSPDGAMILPTTDSTMQILEAHSDLVSGLAFAKEISSRMDELSRVPSVALGTMQDIPRGQISGIALQTLYQPLLEKTEMKRRAYGDMLVELCQRLLSMAGYGDAIDITIHWPSLLPTDDLQQAQAAQIWLVLSPDWS
jgi:hypothetical protein